MKFTKNQIIRAALIVERSHTRVNKISDAMAAAIAYPEKEWSILCPPKDVKFYKTLTGLNTFAYTKLPEKIGDAVILVFSDYCKNPDTKKAKALKGFLKDVACVVEVNKIALFD